jgi:hypothetical protein
MYSQTNSQVCHVKDGKHLELSIPDSGPHEAAERHAEERRQKMVCRERADHLLRRVQRLAGWSRLAQMPSGPSPLGLRQPQRTPQTLHTTLLLLHQLSEADLTNT